MFILASIVSAVGILIYVVHIFLTQKEKAFPKEILESQRLFADVKSNANRYNIEFDNCEFKDSSYLSEVKKDNSDYQLASSLVGSSIGSYYTPIERVETVQSVLFYKDEKLFKGKRFFQTFFIDKTNLKFHVIKGNVSLYIDKDNADKYFFDLVPE